MEFPFEVLDKMSGPLSRMDKELQKLSSDIRHTDTQMAGLEKHLSLQSVANGKGPLQQQLGLLQHNRDAWRGMAGEMSEAAESKAAGSMLGQLKGIGESLGPWAMIGGFVLDLGTKAAEAASKVLELGEAFFHAAIEEANFKTITTRTLEAMLGSRQAAEESFAAIAGAAESTRMTRKELAAMYEDLLAFKNEGGLTEKNIQDIIAASMDVGAIQGQGAQEALLQVIKNAQSTGSFDDRSLRELRGIAAATPQKFLQYLAQQHHMSVAQVKALLQSGKISAAEGTKALLDLIQKNADKGGPLGSTAGSIAKSDIFIQLKNIKERLRSLFEGVDLKPLNNALEYISKLLDPTGEKFIKLRTAIEGTFNKVATFIDKVVESGAVEVVVDAIIGAFNLLNDALGFLAQVNIGPLIADVKSLANEVVSTLGNSDSLKLVGEAMKIIAQISFKGTVGGLELLIDRVKVFVSYVGTVLRMADALLRMSGTKSLLSKFSIGGETAGAPGAKPATALPPPNNSPAAGLLGAKPPASALTPPENSPAAGLRGANVADALSRMNGAKSLLSKFPIGGETAGRPGAKPASALTPPENSPAAGLLGAKAPSAALPPPDNSAAAHAIGNNTGVNYAQGLALGMQQGGAEARAAATPPDNSASAHAIGNNTGVNYAQGLALGMQQGGAEARAAATPPDNSASAHAIGTNTGVNFAQGLALGILQGGAEARAAATELGEATVNAIRNRLGIHSPSDVMMQLGVYTAQGFQQGLDSAAPPSVDFSPSIKAPGGAGGGHSIQVGDIVVNVAGGGHDAAAMGQEIARTVRAEIVRFTDGLAIEA